MPLVGWLLGTQFASSIESFDHWVAFGLLAIIGAKMLWEAIRPGEDDEVDTDALDLRELGVLAVATSIDALAVGISFAFLDVSIGGAVTLIGVVTAIVTFGGIVVGRRMGARFGRPAEILGGLVLIGIGTKILLEHTGVL